MDRTAHAVAARASTPTVAAPEPWQDALRHGLRSFEQLEAEGLLQVDEVPGLRARFGHLRLGIPRAYAARFDRRNLRACPLWRQAVPWAAEQDPVLPAWAEARSQDTFGQPAPWRADAIGDVAHLAAPRLTHRYRNRALLHVTAACALYCRFCFRKAHLASREASLYAGSLAPALQYVAEHGEIEELVLSGGDPLVQKNAWWHGLLQALQPLRHVRVLRVHSRVPATVPQRLDAELLRAWRETRLQVVLVSHFNHPRELSALARQRLSRAARAGVTLLNQAVLLAGVNDRVAVLTQLCRRLYATGVRPYYLHHPDYTPDTFGFRLSVARGRSLVRRLNDRLSGPARPRYILELPGGGGKVDLLVDPAQPTQVRRDAAASLGAASYAFLGYATRHAAPGPTRYLDLHPLPTRGVVGPPATRAFAQS